MQCFILSQKLITLQLYRPWQWVSLKLDRYDFMSDISHIHLEKLVLCIQSPFKNRFLFLLKLIEQRMWWGCGLWLLIAHLLWVSRGCTVFVSWILQAPAVLLPWSYLLTDRSHTRSYTKALRAWVKQPCFLPLDFMIFSLISKKTKVRRWGIKSEVLTMWCMARVRGKYLDSSEVSNNQFLL